MSDLPSQQSDVNQMGRTRLSRPSIPQTRQELKCDPLFLYRGEVRLNTAQSQD